MKTARIAALATGLVFAALVVVFVVSDGDTDVGARSPLLGQPAPAVATSTIDGARFELARRKGSWVVLNFFNSTCVPCIAEAPVLMELKQRGVPIDAIAIRDAPDDVADFLRQHGDPFQRIGSDMRSQVQMSLGSSGVPESFVVDDGGIIRYQHIGPLTDADVPTILAELERAR